MTPFNSIINRLKAASPYYPELLKFWNSKEYWVSTIVPFEYNGKKYGRLVCQSLIPDPNNPDLVFNDTEAMVHDMAEQTKQHAIPTDRDALIH